MAVIEKSIRLTGSKKDKELVARCSLKRIFLQILDKNGEGVPSMTFNFSGFYLVGGLKLAFK